MGGLARLNGLIRLPAGLALHKYKVLLNLTKCLYNTRASPAPCKYPGKNPIELVNIYFHPLKQKERCRASMTIYLRRPNKT